MELFLNSKILKFFILMKSHKANYFLPHKNIGYYIDSTKSIQIKQSQQLKTTTKFLIDFFHKQTCQDEKKRYKKAKFISKHFIKKLLKRNAKLKQIL